MNRDTFTAMVRDGNTAIDVLQNVTESKRILMRAMVDAYIDGMIAHERLTNQAARPSA